MAENLGLPEGFVIDDNSTELPEGFVMDKSPVQEEEQGFFGAVGEDLSQRGAEIANIAGGGYPEQTIGEDILQTGGQIIGGVGDVAGEAIGRGLSAIIPDVIEDPVVGYTKQLLGAAGETGAAQQAGEYIQDLTTEYPRAARNLGAAFNVASAIPAVGAVKAVGKVVEDVSKAISSGKPVTLGDLKAAETEAYNKARTQAAESGTLINTGGVKRRIDFNLKNSFGKPNVGPVDIDIHPKAAKAIEKIKDRFADKSVDPIEIEHTRRLLSDFVESSKDLGRDTADTVKLYHVMDAFDDAVEGIKPDEFVKGNKEFIDSFNEARKISSVRFKTEPLQDIFDKAENAPKNSSYEQSLKNGFRSLANNKRKMKKYNEKEKFLIRQAARTGKIEGITNKFAVFSPTSGKLGAAITGGLGTGAVTGNPALAIIPAAGMASKAISDKMARGSAQRAYEGVSGQLQPPRASLRDRAQALYGTGAQGLKDIARDQRGMIGTRSVVSKEFSSDPKMNRWVIDKPFKAPKTVFRGTSKETGNNMASYGQGLYTTTNKKVAKEFGDVEEMGGYAIPENPIQFNSPFEFENWLGEIADKAGVSKANLGAERHDIIKGLGYDGVSIGTGKDRIFVSYDIESGMNIPATLGKSTKKPKGNN